MIFGAEGKFVIRIIAIHMVGAEHLQHIDLLRWVETLEPGAAPTTQPQDATRAAMVDFVREHPKEAFVISTNDNTYAFLEVVNAQPPYVKTLPDSTRADNLLSLPRF
jgi:hypothetical protein